MSGRLHENGVIVWLQYGPHIVDMLHPSMLKVVLNVYLRPRVIYQQEGKDQSSLVRQIHILWVIN